MRLQKIDPTQHLFEIISLTWWRPVDSPISFLLTVGHNFLPLFPILGYFQLQAVKGKDFRTLSFSYGRLKVQVPVHLLASSQIPICWPRSFSSCCRHPTKEILCQQKANSEKVYMLHYQFVIFQGVLLPISLRPFVQINGILNVVWSVMLRWPVIRSLENWNFHFLQQNAIRFLSKTTWNRYKELSSFTNRFFSSLMGK